MEGKRCVYVPRELGRVVLGPDSNHSNVRDLLVREQDAFKIGRRDLEPKKENMNQSPRAK